MTQNIINAMPTKELFIEMLTRDIPLIPAIVDLVDNCVDGARAIRGNKPYDGLYARIEISDRAFRIADNCGGIGVDVARNYAFRFGRPLGMPAVKHSIGEFGVGMKRAIFKIGGKFRVESSTATSCFLVEEDVKEWALKTGWEYKFSKLEENISVPEERRGTIIEVNDLREDVSHFFALENFKSELREDLKTRLQDALSRGFAITLDGIPINSEPLNLLSGTALEPVFKELKFPEHGPKPVKVRLYCGLGKEGFPNLAGWHVFCNGRLVLEADKTAATGWGESDGVSIPGFHAQYNRLRGYAYFDCDDPGKLPWNTTKTGVNTDSPVYRAAKQEMMRLMRPVVDFLNRLKEEKEAKDEEDGNLGPLESLLENSKEETVKTVTTRDVFSMPHVEKRVSSPMTKRIQYSMPKVKVDRAMKSLRVSKLKEVGEKTFNYYYDAEIEE